MELYLKQNDVLLGTLRSYDSDFPWINCKFEPSQAFQLVKPLFDEELKLLDEEDWEKYDEAYSLISALNLELINLSEGKVTTDFLLHIQGDEAWFRM